MSALTFRDKPDDVFFPFGFGPITVPTPFSVAGAVLLGGWSVIETTGAATAQLDLIDGGANGGIVVATIALAAGACNCEPTIGKGISIQNTLFLQVNSGSVRGSIWLADQ